MLLHSHLSFIRQTLQTAAWLQTFPLWVQNMWYFANILTFPFFSLQVYVINVTYSDNTSHIIYRRYSKFFDLQVLFHPPWRSVRLAFIPHPQFYRCCCIFRHISPVNLPHCFFFFFLNIDVLALWLCSLCHRVCARVLHTSSPQWINVCVSNWLGNRGDMVCIPSPHRDAAICYNSLSLSLYCLYFYPTVFLPSSSSLSSHLCLTLKTSGSWQAFFMVQARNLRGSQFNVVVVHTLSHAGCSDWWIL